VSIGGRVLERFGYLVFPCPECEEVEVDTTEAEGDQYTRNGRVWKNVQCPGCGAFYNVTFTYRKGT